MSSSALRVVVLARDSSLRVALSAPGIAVAQVATPYEAAAEVLAQPAAAVIIDLKLLGPRHLRLLEVLRGEGAVVLGFGQSAIGVAAGQLAGVRTVSREHLSAALEQLRLAIAPPARALDAELAELSAAIRTTPLPVPAQPAPADQAAAQAASDQPSQRPAVPPAPETRLAPAHGQDDIREILTPQEISALLEDER